MRLKNIKLAGFKSFVDPTNLALPGDLTAIVGPNGCGKSNVIDAIRWVMGESSAKQLRGESLDDVIFNGSSGRKPVGQAAIELHFDNSSGRLEGQYASYAEMIVRREIARDGQSQYYLNNTRCRRRDITDLFLGTGLGPRSYAIIEQGTISRIVDAKPDELRAFVEEAAGISKYKERRREAELRIQHAQENMARLNDIRDELSKQLDHLQRQAKAAERYQTLKQEERLLKAQIQVLRWQVLNGQLQTQSELITQQEIALAQATTALQEIEAQLEQQRTLQSQAVTQNNASQARFYQVDHELKQTEQTIQHQQERQQQWRGEQVEIEQKQRTLKEELTTTQQRYEILTNEVASCLQQQQQAQQVAEQSQQTLKQAEQALHEWQMGWDDFNQQNAYTTQCVQVERTRMQHLEQHLHTLQQRIARLQEEQAQHTALTTGPNDELLQQLGFIKQQQQEIEVELTSIAQSMSDQAAQNQRLLAELDVNKHRLQTLYGQQTSLEALQKAALGQQEGATTEWLQQQQLADKPRLGQTLQVEAGWEQAVETVLEKYLQAVCIDDIASLATALTQLPHGKLSLLAKSNELADVANSKDLITLASKILHTPWPLISLLTGIYVADDVATALTLRSSLTANESIITRAGIWLGNNWLLTSHKSDTETGILQRERALADLKKELDALSAQIQEQQKLLVAGQTQLQQIEQRREISQQRLVEIIASQNQLHAEQQVKQAQLTQAKQRAQQIAQELQDCLEQLTTAQTTHRQAQAAYEEAMQALNLQKAQREELLINKNRHQTVLDNTRQQALRDKEAAHQTALNLQAAQMQSESLKQAQAHIQQQLQQSSERIVFLQKSLADHESSFTGLHQQQQVLTEKRLIAEQETQTIHQQLEQVEQQLRQLEKQRHSSEQLINNIRNELEQARLAGQSLQVRAKTVQEQIDESGHTIEALLAELPAEATETGWEEQLIQVTRRIERLGPINLAALEEYNAQAERKTQLDAQHADLTEALTALENAIHKMDRETRTRFQDTFTQLNARFQTLFPHLFGGGRATLELIGDDLLAAGVTVMAQPPGKRNSTIHLLSGGEKALTAISLVFALFQLNPAPFCMLDEVDAPLDDANVGRFCKLVKEMSSQVQFIFISHNKLAIEMAHHLVGVTMQEAGVSRLVAVDVDEAIAMAAA